MGTPIDGSYTTALKRLRAGQTPVNSYVWPNERASQSSNANPRDCAQGFLVDEDVYIDSDGEWIVEL